MNNVNSVMPKLGFGTWNRDGDEAYQSVCDALDIGYRHIDTAQAYSNEDEVGRALKHSGVSRDDFFLTTKIDPVNYGPGCVMPSVESSLDKLGVEQVDLLLLHFPSLFDEFDVKDYVNQLAEVHQSGKCRFIGVSNFTRFYLDHAIAILGAEAILTNQVEIHAYMQNRPIVDYCRDLGIGMTAYSPLARGQLIDDALLVELSKKYECTSAQVALAFLLAEGHTVIPSSSNRKRAIENFGAMHISLSTEDVKRIRTLDKGLRLVDEDWCPKWDE